MILHTNRGELALLVDTFCRVWEAGGQATLTTTTKDGQVQANLELQLGHPADARPGAPRVQERLSAGTSSTPLHPGHPGAARRPRHRGPAARAKNRTRAALYQAAKAGAGLAEAASASPAGVATPSLPQTGQVGPSTPTAPAASSPTSDSVVTTTLPSITVPVMTPSTTSVATSVPDVATSPSPGTASTTFNGPVFGPSLPFLWSAALVSKNELPRKCDRCEFSSNSMYELRVHREKKHRLWECLRCDETFHNQRSFDKHNNGPEKWFHDCDLHPFAQEDWQFLL